MRVYDLDFQVLVATPVLKQAHDVLSAFASPVVGCRT